MQFSGTKDRLRVYGNGMGPSDRFEADTMNVGSMGTGRGSQRQRRPLSTWQGSGNHRAKNNYVNEVIERLVQMVQRRKARGDNGSAVRRLFLTFDRKGKGRITAADFQRTFAEFGIRLSDGESQAILDRFDLDGAGFVDYPSFLRIPEGGLDTLDPRASKLRKRFVNIHR